MFQGKAIVNSISMKEGEEVFRRQAQLLKRYGAGCRCDGFRRNRSGPIRLNGALKICQRAYNILVNEINFPPQDIIFDSNILIIGTGMEEHYNYAVDFINAVSWIKKNLKQRQNQRRSKQCVLFFPRK